MDCIMRIPVTSAVFAAMAVLLSGCIAYNAVSTVASVGGTVVHTCASAASTTADIVTSPFGSEDSKKQ